MHSRPRRICNSIYLTCARARDLARATPSTTEALLAALEALLSERLRHQRGAQPESGSTRTSAADSVAAYPSRSDRRYRELVRQRSSRSRLKMTAHHPTRSVIFDPFLPAKPKRRLPAFERGETLRDRSPGTSSRYQPPSHAVTVHLAAIPGTRAGRPLTRVLFENSLANGSAIF